MNITRAYKCTVCNKVKNILDDPFRAIPNSCTITLGCTGTLNRFDTQGKLIPDSQSDWIARGSSIQSDKTVEAEKISLMSVSSNGALTVALKMDDASDIVALNVKFEQRRTESVKFTQFTFLTSSSTPTISGKDSRGKTLRIDSAAFAEGRIKAKVNGVMREDFTVIPGQNASIQFSTTIAVSSTVDIFVYFEKEVEEKILTFEPNFLLPVNSLTGAWGNLKWIYLPDKITKEETKYWLFTVTSTASMLPSSYARLVEIEEIHANEEDNRIVDISDVEFLLTKKPFSHFDRYMLGTIPASVLNASFEMFTSSRTIRDFSIASKNIVNIFPLIKIYYNGPSASLSTANTIYSDKGILAADALDQYLPQSNFLLGVT